MKFWCIKKGMSVCLFLTPHTISLSLSFVCVAFAFFSFSTVRPYLIFNIYDIVLSAIAFSIQIPFLLIFLFLHCICGTIVVLKVFRYLLFSLCEIEAGSFCWIVRQFLFTLLFLHTNKPPWLRAKSTLPSLSNNICTIANPWRHIRATSVLCRDGHSQKWMAPETKYAFRSRDMPYSSLCWCRLGSIATYYSRSLGGFFKNSWKKRYFVLYNDGQFCYFQDPNDRERDGQIHMKTECRRIDVGYAVGDGVKSPKDTNPNNLFSVASPDRTWYLCAETESECR